MGGGFFDIYREALPFECHRGLRSIQVIKTPPFYFVYEESAVLMVRIALRSLKGPAEEKTRPALATQWFKKEVWRGEMSTK